MNKHDYRKIAYAETYTNEKKLHSIFSAMRRDDPVTWIEPENFRPFWALTKHDNITEIEKLNDVFINDPRTTLTNIPTEQAIKDFTGGSHILVLSLIHI